LPHSLVNISRDKDQEEVLVNIALDRKAINTVLEISENECKCAYCGLLELDICSPMVVGQTYTEHQVYLELNQDDVSLDLPYFPVISGDHGRELLSQVGRNMYMHVLIYTYVFKYVYIHTHMYIHLYLSIFYLYIASLTGNNPTQGY
jgi:hypothetical protein